MKRSTRFSLYLAVALGAFAIIGGTGLTVSSAWLITMAAQHPPILVLGVSIVMVRFFGIFRSAARYGERVISHEAIFKRLTGLRVELFKQMSGRMREPFAAISARSKALVDDVERAEEFHLRVTLPARSALAAGIATLLIAIWIDATIFLLVLPVFTFFTVVIPWLVRRKLDPITTSIEDKEMFFASEIASASHAMIEAEIYGYGERYRAKLKTLAQQLERAESKLILRTSLIQSMVLIASGLTLAGTALWLYSQSNLLPITIAMAIFLALVGFEGYTSWFPNLFVSGKNRRAAFTVQSFADKTERKVTSEISAPSYQVAAVGLVPFWSEKFLSPINFSLEHGETLVITGPSGIGKSTLAAALFGFAPYEGSLTIGGVEVSEITDLSSCISGTLQNSYIFNTSLRENLKIADSGLSDEKLREVVKAMELDAISLDEILGEFGRTLSGGEAKRLAIARALLSPAPIVLLDEPLEHLDSLLAQRIQSAISLLLDGRSLIVITHSPWLQYSRKLTLERE